MQRVTSLKGGINTDMETILSNIRANIRRPLPQAKPYEPQEQELIVALGGPSLETEFDRLDELYYEKCKVVSVNGTHDWLVERGVYPSIHVMLDARETNARFVANPLPNCQYFVASQCHPAIFDALEGHKVTIFHSDYADENEEVAKVLKDYYLGRYHVVIGGSTVGLRAIMLTRMLGFIHQHIFGFDSCWMEDKHHAYEQPENAKEKRIKVRCAGRHFECAPWHLKQAEDFQRVVAHSGELINPRVYGRGLIATIIRNGGEIEDITDGC